MKSHLFEANSSSIYIKNETNIYGILNLEIICYWYSIREV